MNRALFVAGVGLLACVGYRPAGGTEPPKAGAPLRPPSVRSLAYSPDGKALVAGVGRRDEPGAVVAWAPESRKPLWEKRGSKGFSSVSFAPDGKSVAVAH